MIPSAVKQVHFIGIGGYGMSALAQVLLQMGYTVTGSDIKESAVTRHLEKQGATVYYRHHAVNITGCQLAIYSTAIPADNPELQEARRRGIPLWHRSELLAALMNERYGIAVAGTHGKTTTTAMISLLLEKGGFDPTAIVGGIISTFGGNACLGRSKYLVAEACESDHSFLRYRPRMALITNVEPDHLEHYRDDFNLLKKAYKDFLNNLPADGTAVLCAEDPFLRQLSGQLKCRTFLYALEGESSVHAKYTGREIALAGFGSSFVFCEDGRPLAEVKLRVPGRHNVSNAVGALALAAQLGLDPGTNSHALESFSGAGRRFEVVGVVNEITIIDDYAHHPTEVRATLAAARAAGGRVCCVFQPHRFTRTAYFFEEFCRSFGDADMVLLHRIYAAGEEPIDGITSQYLAQRIRQIKDGLVYVSDDMSELEEVVVQLLQPGDILLVMGAGDISRLAYRVKERLQTAGDT